MNSLVDSRDDIAINPINATDVEARLCAFVDGMVRQQQGAMSGLYDETIHRVYGLALTITGFAADAEEVSSDVYWQAWQCATEYDPKRGSVLAWLLMMTRSRALDKRRRRKAIRMDNNKEAFDFDVLEADVPSVEENVLANQSEKAVRKALQCLNPIQRKLILLAYFRDCSHQELSLQLSLPLGTVKSHIRRGLEVLRTELARVGVA